MNSQLVLCPDINDKDEIRRSLDDLTSLENMECIAAVPVGITKYREGLAHIRPFEKTDALNTLDIIDEYAQKCIGKYGECRIYASDEFYLIAEKEMPDSEFYGDFCSLKTVSDFGHSC